LSIIIKKREIYKDEFYEYFERKGYTKEQIKLLWFLIIGKSRMVKWGVQFEADEIPPKKIKSKPFIELIR